MVFERLQLPEFNESVFPGSLGIPWWSECGCRGFSTLKSTKLEGKANRFCVKNTTLQLKWRRTLANKQKGRTFSFWLEKWCAPFIFSFLAEAWRVCVTGIWTVHPSSTSTEVPVPAQEKQLKAWDLGTVRFGHLGGVTLFYSNQTEVRNSPNVKLLLQQRCKLKRQQIWLNTTSFTINWTENVPNKKQSCTNMK